MPFAPLLALLLLIAFPALAIEPGTYTDRTLVYRGVTRTYDLRVPTGYDGTTPVPLVLDLHGLGSNKAQQRAVSGLAPRADTEGFAIAWPNGTGSGAANSWNGGFCCGAAADEDVDDTGYLRSLVDAIAQEVVVDRRRVYATGISNGGAMTQRLACEAADVFAAAAPLAFPIGLLPIESCAPSRPIPVLTFQGTTDVLVPYEGAGPFPSALESFTHWRTEGGCGSGEVEESTVSGDSDCAVDTSCAPGVEVGLCSILSTEEIVGGHILYINPDFDLAEVAWAFLSRFTLPADAGTPLPQPVAGKKLQIRDEADPAKRRVALALKDAAIALDPATDPTADGAELVLFGSATTLDLACLPLPAANWKRKGAGFVYKDKQGAAGPCTSAKLAAGRLDVTCSGKAAALEYTLDEPSQGGVAARFATSQQAFCTTFGGSVQKDTSTAAGKAQFAAKSAPAPATCPAPAPCP
jgi:polyhydroxybutyrate depolymerase